MKKQKAFLYCLIVLSIGLLFPVLSAREASAAAKATNAKIHFINLNANNDAILLECDGQFGMVDSGEDGSYPDGSSKRYPWRAGIVKGNGQGQKVIDYLRSVGVKRLEFYIGTHPHSDHIGNAHQIIKAFRPKRVYLRPYKDSYITNQTRLWDNLYVYDNTLKAIKEVNRQASNAEDGITLIQYLKKNAAYVDPLRKIKSSVSHSMPTYNAPVESESDGDVVIDYTPMIPNTTYDAAPLSLTGNSKPQTAKPVFTLGDDMTIEILNYDAKLSAPDANYFCLGVKVTANGSTAFLSGDINNYWGAEDRLASQIGHVDLLKLGHHGYYGSNTVGYLKKLSPDIAVLTGTVGQTRKEMWDTLASTSTRTYITTLYADSIEAIVANMNSKISTNIGRDSSLSNKIVSGYSANLNAYLYLKNGKKVVGGGFQRVGSAGYYFPAGSDMPLTNKWYQHKGKWYYFGPDGRMKTGWLQLENDWYYCNKDGTMQTGWLEVKGQKYYLSSSGRMVTGDKKIGKYWYHFRSSGSMFTGWLENRLYYDEQGRLRPGRSKIGWQKYDGGYKWRYKNGTYAKSTWKTIKGNRYYFHANGYRASGMTKIGQKTYYFSASGKLSAGWKTIKSNKYYFTKQGMYTGFHTIQGKTYYFKNNGVLLQNQGLKTIAGNRYFFNPDNTAATGWKNINGKKYYFRSNGQSVSGWQTIDGNEYYFNAKGAALSGFQTIENSHYLFDESGILQKAPAAGWHSFNGADYYYFQTESTLQTEWLTLEIPNADGAPQTCQYYLDPKTGIMATGLLKLQDSYYYFLPEEQISANTVRNRGQMVTGQQLTITQDGDTGVYEFDESGKGVRLLEAVAVEVSDNTMLEKGEEDYAN